MTLNEILTKDFEARYNTVMLDEDMPPFNRAVAVIDALVSPHSCVRQRFGDDFSAYDDLMTVLGFGVKGATSLTDYASVVEVGCNINSLNECIFVLDARSDNSRFVKFYKDADACAKDVRVQNFLAGSGKVSGTVEIDLPEGYDNTLPGVRKLLANDVIDGDRLYTVLEGATVDQARDVLFRLVDTALGVQDYANDALRYESAGLKRKSYVEDAKTFLEGSPEGLDIVQGRLDELMADPKNVSFVHGDLHPNNAIVCYDGEIRIFDFEMSDIALKVTDLIRIHIAAEKFGLGEEVKDRYFAKAFGADYDRELCDEMLSLACAAYYIENVDKYRQKIATSTDEERVSWSKKIDYAEGMIRSNLAPYAKRDVVEGIVGSVIRPARQELR